ncbi:MerR family transcriptional regulator [Mesobacterium sp. TK19101]|uniref:MerR family transcriptional regulator n=1 Tax=Mesobacterium hydrothermale TaxID=3111907 RepID=A0ABU6HLQ2_9RHOB|nr:MerR family transcriptional regulator [Mesobacterium sp. TK19101]MEC3863302.1 MerR family transcriptional regulator [Mesobacterium sp. TK19101]
MNQLTQIKIRFSDAAHAIGVKPKVLRNWLQRNQITLFSDHTGAKWTQFTLGDIAVLAVMRRLVEWGIKVDQANDIAFALIQGKAGMLIQYRHTPKEALIAFLRTFRLLLAHDDDTGDLLTATVHDREALPLGSTDFVFVNIGLVVEVAFSRLETD